MATNSRIELFSGRGFALAMSGVMVVAIAFKAALLIGDAFPFNADEAIVALMADHILAGDWPVFFYGQAYMGSLDASLVAILFAMFGQAVVWIRILQSILFLGLIASSMQITRKLTNSLLAATVTGLLLAVPPVNVTLYSTISLGGYGEALLLGNVLLLISIRWLDGGKTGIKLIALWGLLAGIGFWAFGLTMIYILPTGLVMVYRIYGEGSRSKRLKLALVAVLGLMVGLAPLLVWAWEHSPKLLVDEFLGAAIRGTSGQTAIGGILAHVVNLLLFGPTVLFGFRPPWSTRWLAPGLSLFPLLFWSLIPASWLQRARRGSRLSRHTLLLVAVAGCLVAGFILTPFGNDPSGRYFLPLYPLAAVGAGVVVHSVSDNRSLRKLTYALLAGTVVFNVWGNLQTGFVSDSGITTQFDAVTRIDHGYDIALIDFLIAKGETTGYTNYWVTYPLAFQSNEELIFIPALPYHPDLRYTERDNRYQPYNQIVAESPHWAYITTLNPALDHWLTQALDEAGASWSESWIGDYHIFYDIQPPTNLDSLGGFK